MLLAIDVGNTEITVGLFLGEQLTDCWRLTTVTARTPDEWMTTLATYLHHLGHSGNEVRAVVHGSVAPALTPALEEGIHKATGVVSVSVGPESPLPVVLDVEEPLSVGADRVVNTLAAAHLYHRDTVVVDFGTATSFDCITADARFIGGVIAPGLRTAAEDLVRRAAKLPATALTPPIKVIGKRTEDCIRSGVLYGAVDATDGLVRRIKGEWPGGGMRGGGGGAPYVVATGGLAPQIAPLSREIETVEPDLTLLGLRIAASHLGLRW